MRIRQFCSGRAVAPIVTLLFLLGSMSEGDADPVYCLDGQANKRCSQYTLEEKVELSLSRALFVVIGRFGSDLQLSTNLEGQGVIYPTFEFNIEKQLKGSLENHSLQLKFSSYLVRAKMAATRSEKPLSKISVAQFEKLEMSSEERMRIQSREQYEGAVRDLRKRMKEEGAIEERNVYMVPIELGNFDAPYRITDVPLRFGDLYAIFIMSKDVLVPQPTGREIIFLRNPIDIYSLSGPRGMRVKATIEKYRMPGVEQVKGK